MNFLYCASLRTAAYPALRATFPKGKNEGESPRSAQSVIIRAKRI